MVERRVVTGIRAQIRHQNSDDLVFCLLHPLSWLPSFRIPFVAFLNPRGSVVGYKAHGEDDESLGIEEQSEEKAIPNENTRNASWFKFVLGIVTQIRKDLATIVAMIARCIGGNHRLGAWKAFAKDSSEIREGERLEYFVGRECAIGIRSTERIASTDKLRDSHICVSSSETRTSAPLLRLETIEEDMTAFDRTSVHVMIGSQYDFAIEDKLVLKRGA
ncbi:hypothetical protein Tco_1106544 [Tanacetum coccineum]